MWPSVFAFTFGILLLLYILAESINGSYLPYCLHSSLPSSCARDCLHSCCCWCDVFLRHAEAVSRVLCHPCSPACPPGRSPWRRDVTSYGTLQRPTELLYRLCFDALRLAHSLAGDVTRHPTARFAIELGILLYLFPPMLISFSDTGEGFTLCMRHASPSHTAHFTLKPGCMTTYTSLPL